VRAAAAPSSAVHSWISILALPLAALAAGAAACEQPAPRECAAARPNVEGGGRAAVASLATSAPAGASRIDHDDEYLYRLPYGEAVSYPVLQGYGTRFSHRGAEHFTVDFRMPVGTPVHAAREGVVLRREDSHTEACALEECSALANYIVVLHEDGTTGEYYHLDRGSIAVRAGERVGRGQLLARSGNTGYSTVPHLHFGVYRRGADGASHSVPARFRARNGAVGAPRAGAHYFNVKD
jgi:murein DD-endopeptidase MepM/ murein hydrolase activator NlpD